MPLTRTEIARRFRKKHPEKIRAWQRAYDKAHPGKKAATTKRYRQRHPDKVRAAKKAYSKAHPEKKKAWDATYAAKNRELLAAKSRAYRNAHLEEARAKKRAYEKAHPKESNARSLKYHKTHPEQSRAASKRYRANKAAAPINDLTAAQWKAIKEHYGHRCVYCRRKMQRLTQDHITPLSKGGSHTLTNVVPACLSCNVRKYNNAPPIPVQPLLLL